MLEKTLLLFTHPAIDKSLANRALLREAYLLSHVTVHDLYAEYPDFHIDVLREQSLVEAHERIIWQYPFYWYSCPALLKEWFDLVLQYGWAFGSGATALKGKKVSSIITTGSEEGSYGPEGRNNYRVEDFLRPMEQTAHLCAMHYEKPLVFYQVLNWKEEEKQAALLAYRQFLLGGA